MSLLSTDISKIRRLTLKGVKPPVKERRPVEILPPSPEITPETPFILTSPPPTIQPEEEKEPEIRSIKEIGHIVEKVGKADGKTLYRYSFKPGSLAELEDLFCKHPETKRLSIKFERMRIASLIDKYKRTPPSEAELQELRDRITIPKTEIHKPFI